MNGIFINIDLNYWDFSWRFFEESYLDLTIDKIGFKPVFFKDERYYNKINKIHHLLLSNLKKFSYSTFAGKFIPIGAYDEWNKNNTDITDSLYLFKHGLLNNQDILLEEFKTMNLSAIKNVWFRLYNDDNPTENFIIEKTKEIVDIFPTKEVLFESINADINHYALYNITEIQSIPIRMSDRLDTCTSHLVEYINKKHIESLLMPINKIIDFYKKKNIVQINMFFSAIDDLKMAKLMSLGDVNLSLIDKILNVFDELNSKKITDSEFIITLSTLKKAL